MGTQCELLAAPPLPVPRNSPAHLGSQASGELTGEPTYSTMMFFGHTNAVGKVMKQSEKFQKKLGEPALPMGGPAFDGMGNPVQVAQ